jgi:toxin ParE1/3/4
VRVRWLDEAVLDLKAVKAYITRDPAADAKAASDKAAQVSLRALHRLLQEAKTYEERIEVMGYIEAATMRTMGGGKGERGEEAADIARRIREAVRILAEYPEAGRVGRVPHTQEVVVSGTPYVLPYRIKANAIEILRVLHAAQDWPDR